MGATYLGEGRCRFRVWAPYAHTVALHIVAPENRIVPLHRAGRGYYEAVVSAVPPGSRYFYLLDGKKERPDPASRYQPEGVHGPSAVVDLTRQPWPDERWRGHPQEELIFYELHVGTFTPEGTFQAIIPYLPELAALGITVVELMPVAQFPGSRNWGYDGVYPFAVQNTYGGPQALRQFVAACHQQGFSVFLDVVYNHLGPEGNYLGDFGPYFTDRYQTPWGRAINFDGPGSDEVRRFFIENALYWVTEFAVDGLRLDAVHAIFDQSARHFLAELAATVRQAAAKRGRRVHLIAESDLNNARLIRPPLVGGYGLDAQWSDDFHHALHALLTGEANGYYRDFGLVEHLAKAFRCGFVYTGEYSAYRERRHGGPTELCKPEQFVVFAQNHDQVGNRALGERLSTLVPFPALKLAAGVVLLSPFLPLIFMGEEYGETAPFQYFTSHTDPELAAAVVRNRRAEFARFGWAAVPDPQDEATFRRSRLHRERLQEDRSGALFAFYRELIRLRRTLPPLANLSWEQMAVTAFERERVLLVRRWNGATDVALIFSFNPEPQTVTLPLPGGPWEKLLDAAAATWLGAGSPTPARFWSEGAASLPLSAYACVVLEQVREE